MPYPCVFTDEAGAEPGPLLLWLFTGLLYQPWMMMVIVEQLVE
jgi:hypothetical protein